VFVYLIMQSKSMAERNVKQVQAAQEQFDAQVRAATGERRPLYPR